MGTPPSFPTHSPPLPCESLTKLKVALTTFLWTFPRNKYCFQLRIEHLSTLLNLSRTGYVFLSLSILLPISLSLSVAISLFRSLSSTLPHRQSFLHRIQLIPRIIPIFLRFIFVSDTHSQAGK